MRSPVPIFVLSLTILRNIDVNTDDDENRNEHNRKKNEKHEVQREDPELSVYVNTHD